MLNSRMVMTKKTWKMRQKNSMLPLMKLLLILMMLSRRHKRMKIKTLCLPRFSNICAPLISKTSSVAWPFMSNSECFATSLRVKNGNDAKDLKRSKRLKSHQTTPQSKMFEKATRKIRIIQTRELRNLDHHLLASYSSYSLQSPNYNVPIWRTFLYVFNSRILPNKQDKRII